MANDLNVYEEYAPGQLIDAKRMNNMQTKIKEDITNQTKKAIEEIKSVKSAENTTLFGGKSIAQLTEDILKAVFQELPKKTGYLQVFKQLKVNEEEVIKHNLRTFPLVDIYQLDYFRVVISEDGNKPYIEEMQRLLPLTENQPELSDSLNEVSVTSLAQSPVVKSVKSLKLHKVYDTKAQTLAPEPPVQKIVLIILKIVVIFPTNFMKEEGRTSLLTSSNTTEDAVTQPLSVGINLSPRFRILLERSLFFNQEQVLDKAIPKLFKKLRKHLFHWTRKWFSQA